MILVDISLELSDTSKYSIKVNDMHIPKGETPFSEKALNEIIRFMNMESIALPDAISIEKEFHFFLAYHETAKLTSKISEKMPDEMYLSQESLAQEIRNLTNDIEDNNSKQEDCHRYPILHVSSANLLSGDKRIVHSIRYFNIMDSSIWNYYISFQDLLLPEGREHLGFIFEQIIRNQIGKLYELRISTEYADLNARLLHDDYTDPLGHGSSVTPFLFHSEWKMKKMRDNIIENNQEIVKRRWRFLLLDDCVMDSLRLHSEDRAEYKQGSGEIINSSKLAIVQRVIRAIPQLSFSWRFYESGKLVDQSSKELEENTVIQVWCVKSIRDALLMLKEFKFDIVLIDYLLGEHTISNNVIKEEANSQVLSEDIVNEMLQSLDEDIKSSSKEYGYQLLKRIKPLLFPNSKFLGPLGRQYFMFISAFTTAVNDRLRAEGLNRSEKFWFIAEGACPTNTPQLFLYNLIKLMEKRLDDSGILNLSSDAIYKLINEIYLRKEEDPKRETVRKRANTLFQKVLSLQYHYRNILKDVEIPFGKHANDFDTKGSVLMTNFIQNKVNLGGMLEHLTQLVHLTAFGTVRQWPEMWEEYIYFKTQFEKQINEEKGSDNVDAQELRDLFSNIEKHILDLKSQQQ